MKLLFICLSFCCVTINSLAQIDIKNTKKLHYKLILNKRYKCLLKKEIAPTHDYIYAPNEGYNAFCIAAINNNVEALEDLFNLWIFMINQMIIMRKQ